MSTHLALDPRLSDPDAAPAMVEINRLLSEGPPRHTMPVEYARGRRRPVRGDDASLACRATDLDIPGSEGPIRARIYRPAGAVPRCTILYLHGGGWATGDLDINDGVCREVADAAGAAVVSLDYRLAPEHPFPAALDDAWAALLWLNGAGAVELGVPARFAVAGLSAGAALAATVARWSLRPGAPTIVHQLLLCPVTDSDTDRASYRQFGQGLLLTADDMRWFIDMYTAGRSELRADPDAFPGRAEDLGGLPPATLVIAGADPLRDEAVEYGERLAAAGVDAVTDVVPGVFHGFMAVPSILSGRASVRRAAIRMKEAVAS